MEKLSIDKLIANDIVNYGMDKTMSFNYIVSLDDFLSDYDDKTKDYVKGNINYIKEAVQTHDAVASCDFDDSRNEFDLVFYIDHLLTPLERKIYKRIDDQELDNDINLDEVREIAYNMESSDNYDNLLDGFVNKIYKVNEKDM
jgi:hypothetical protein